MSIRRWELFLSLLGDYFIEILYCFLAQTFPSVIFIVLSLASHFCTHKIILFCLPEHSNRNTSHYSVKVYIFSSSSFLINQSFQPQNHFSCSLSCLQFGIFLVMRWPRTECCIQGRLPPKPSEPGWFPLSAVWHKPSWEYDASRSLFLQK